MNTITKPQNNERGYNFATHNASRQTWANDIDWQNTDWTNTNVAITKILMKRHPKLRFDPVYNLVAIKRKELGK